MIIYTQVAWGRVGLKINTILAQYVYPIKRRRPLASCTQGGRYHPEGHCTVANIKFNRRSKAQHHTNLRLSNYPAAVASQSYNTRCKANTQLNAKRRPRMAPPARRSYSTQAKLLKTRDTRFPFKATYATITVCSSKARAEMPVTRLAQGRSGSQLPRKCKAERPKLLKCAKLLEFDNAKTDTCLEKGCCAHQSGGCLAYVA